VTVAALILAAGRSERMGGANKLVATIGGTPLVRIVAEAALASRASPVVAVSGHGAAAVGAALGGLDVAIVHNPDYAAGLSTSLAAGIAALPKGADGAIVLLGDMPQIDPATIDRLIAALDPGRGIHIVVPTHRGERGNPVVWSAAFFNALKALTGDAGGRHLIAANGRAVASVECGPAVAVDVDTPEALAALGGTPA
jgi:molybdenum cofactor cytidylyltransferase